MAAINVLQTKSYKERMTKVLDKAKCADTDLEAFQILGKFLEAEIAMVDKISDTPGFKAWFGGERFDLLAIRVAKK